MSDPAPTVSLSPEYRARIRHRRKSLHSLDQRSLTPHARARPQCTTAPAMKDPGPLQTKPSANNRIRNDRLGAGASLLAAVLLLAIMGAWSVSNPRRDSRSNLVSQRTREWLESRRSLLSTRDPQCNLPEEDPCTLNTTAIGMLEDGYATFYDE